ncbi:UPF0280 family protein [Burkholderiaceae bacterium FT117]|uniref:UPF0280 family protein n=1 Tax=Zeimonas sediminis TaxID=2944268 RepID=UPI0023431116|nr:UPF0280 family protein [Zeimonas sediminis]MCM5572164.1 UPF0280 family protein [Zeimonas sediminis]
MTAQRAPLSGNRWHFSHGPIDLVIGADGEPAAVRAAHEAAWARFATVLQELVGELPALRAPLLPAAIEDGQAGSRCPLRGPVARQMWAACLPFADEFITAMAAVAGAVADEIVASYRRPGIARAWVNNGGDIALHLAEGNSARVGLFADLARLAPLSGIVPGRGAPLGLDGRFEIGAAMPVRGIATSGWRGRSFSLGIADSVTVLAGTAAQADAAATMVANAVDVDDPRIVRRAASELRDDTDLGDRLVVVDVPTLGRTAVAHALHAGVRRARDLHGRGLLRAAVLVCQGQAAVVGEPGARPDAAASGAVAGGRVDTAAGQSAPPVRSRAGAAAAAPGFA